MGTIRYAGSYIRDPASCLEPLPAIQGDVKIPGTEAAVSRETLSPGPLTVVLGQPLGAVEVPDPFSQGVAPPLEGISPESIAECYESPRDRSSRFPP